MLRLSSLLFHVPQRGLLFKNGLIIHDEDQGTEGNKERVSRQLRLGAAAHQRAFGLIERQFGDGGRRGAEQRPTALRRERLGAPVGEVDAEERRSVEDGGETDDDGRRGSGDTATNEIEGSDGQGGGQTGSGA